MIKLDARKQTRQALYERRREAISLHERGVPVMQIVARSGLSWSAVNSAIKQYLAEGDSGLMPLTRGRKRGTGRILTADQEVEVRTFIRKRRPFFYGLKKSLWDRGVVQQLIWQKYELKLSERVVNNYLSRWGLAVKKGPRYEWCSVAVRQWIDRNYKDIVREANEMNAEIYWLMAPRPVDAGLWRSEQAPVTPLPAANSPGRSAQRLSMLAAKNNQGKVFWALSNGRYSPERQIKFIKALIRDTKKNGLFLIRPNTKDYGSKDLARWVWGNQHQVKMFPESGL